MKFCKYLLSFILWQFFYYFGNAQMSANINNINKVVFKYGDTLKIVGSNIQKIDIDNIKGNNRVSLNKINTISFTGNGIDSNYQFIIPQNLKPDVYRLYAINYRGDSLNQVRLIRVSNNYDSLGVIGFGDNLSGQLNISSRLPIILQMATGYYYSLALKEDGTVAVWGFNDNNVLNIPNNLNKVVSISAGGGNALALKWDGTLVVWGYDSTYAATIPTNLDSIVQVSAGLGHSLALKPNGTVIAWGDNDFGQTNVPSGLINIREVTAGFGFSMALTINGSIVFWGRQYAGINNIPENSNYIKVVAGLSHAVGLKSDGTVRAWGYNVSQQTNVPLNVTNVVEIAAGQSFSLALKADGSIIPWGAKYPPNLNNVEMITSGCYSEFGFAFYKISVQTTTTSGGVISPTVYVKNGDSPRINFIANHGFYLQSVRINGVDNFKYLDSTGYTFNNIKSTQSIDVSFTNQKILRLLSTNKSILNIGDTLIVSGSLIDSLILKNKNTIIILNSVKKIALNDIDTQYYFVISAAILDGIYSVQGKRGLDFTSNILLINIYTFNKQNDSVGVVGFGNNFSNAATVPVGLTDIVQMSTGFLFTLALKSDGTVRGWGSTPQGFISIPANLNNVIQISAGYYHGVALKKDGTVIAWGDNTQNQTSIPLDLNNVVQIVAGSNHNLALKSDGTVVGWGSNSNGQIDIPVGLSNVKQITAGFFVSYALKADGTIVAWGNISLNPINIPSGLNNVIQLTSGYLHNLALKSDGTVVGWGNNDYGQINIPNNLNAVTQIVAGQNFSLALTSDSNLWAWGRNINGEINVPFSLNKIINIYSGSSALTSFAFNRLSVQTSSNFGGTISPSFYFKLGDTFRITFAPDAGYLVDSVFINNSYNRDSTKGFTFKNTMRYQNVRVVFKLKTFTVNATSGSNGIISSQGNSIVNYGSSLRYVFSPNIGYIIDSVVINGIRKVDSISSYTFENIRGDSSIRIVFKIKTFIINAQAGDGGIIAPQGDIIVNYDSSVYFKILPNLHYKIDSVVVNDTFVPPTNYFLFDSVRSHQKIRVYFKMLPNYPFISNATNGTISMPQFVDSGFNFRVTYSPNEGYEIDSIFINNILHNNDSVMGYTFYNIRGDSSIRVVYKMKRFKISANSGAGGNIVPRGDTMLNYNQSIQYTITALDTFIIDSIFVNNNLEYYYSNGKQAGEKMTTYNITNIKDSGSIRVVFRKVIASSAPRIVEILPGNSEVEIFIDTPLYWNGGNIVSYKVRSIKGGIEVIQNKNRFTIFGLENDTFYQFYVTAINEYGQESISSDTSLPLQPNMRLKIVNTSVSYGQITNSISITNGSNYQVTYLPDEGYEIDSIIVNGVRNTDSTTSYTFKNIRGDSTIKVVFKIKKFVIHVNSSFGGHMLPQTDTSINYNSSIRILFIADDGYEVDSVLINGLLKTDSLLSYTFYNVLADSSIRVVFKILKFTVTASSGNHGNINPAGSNVVNYNTSIRYFYNADIGYQLDSVFINGIFNKDSTTSYTFKNIRGDSTIKVVFKIKKFVITAIPEMGGVISPQGQTTVIYNASLQYQFVPNIGFEIDSVFLNDTFATKNNSLIIQKIISNQTIRATFKPITYNIYIQLGSHGTIEPFNNGILKVNYGDNINFNIVPDLGYEIDSLLINNIVVANVFTYTFINITQIIPLE